MNDSSTNCQDLTDVESPPADAATAGSPLLWHVRWTVPLHLLLPIGLWWLMQIDSSLAAQVFLGLHVAGMVLLVATAWWWWAHSGDLIALLFINHVASFLVTALLPW